MPFFDAAAGEPLHPVAREALLASLDDGWADPAKLYREGRRARVLLDASREAVAEVLGVRADEVLFTPSGSRALHLAVGGVTAARRRTGRQLVHSAVEHSALLHAAEAHRTAGGTVAEVPVDGLGRIDPGAWRSAVSAEGVALACLQSANHEVGTVQPVAAAAADCAAAGVPLLVDAAQSIGRQAVPEGWSLLAASARKWGGPGGVGVLAVRRRTRFAPEAALPGWREGADAPGTALPSVVAAAAALRAVAAEAEAENARLARLVDVVRERVAASVPDVSVLGDPSDRLPHLVTFSCPYVDGEVLLGALDRAGFAVSSGSSCTADTITPSHVLAAMGAFTGGNVRVSLPRGAAEADVERFLDVLPGIVAEAVPPGAGAGAVVRDGGGGPDDPALVLDVLGLRCPVPVTELARHVERVEVGAAIGVLTDDEVASIDIPAWCFTAGHGYEGARPAPGRSAPALLHVVRRGA